MKISIVIPVYNGADTITDVIASIVKEFENSNYEIILVNDGSRDNSEKICENIALSK